MDHGIIILNKRMTVKIMEAKLGRVLKVIRIIT